MDSVEAGGRMNIQQAVAPLSPYSLLTILEQCCRAQEVLRTPRRPPVVDVRIKPASATHSEPQSSQPNLHSDREREMVCV